MKKIFIVLLLIQTGIFQSGCEKDEDPEVNADGFVKFINTDQVLSTDNLQPVTFEISIEPAAASASFINIGFSTSGGEEGKAFTFSPAADGGQIKLNVENGASDASFMVTPIESGIEFEDIRIDFEILDTGEGLYSEGIKGVFASLQIINDKAGIRPLPFLEDFTTCDNSGGTGQFPAGWEEEVITQNMQGTGHWRCSPNREGFEANAFSEEGFLGDECEVWLISPQVNLENTDNPVLSFDADRRFDSDIQEYDVKISTDYDGTNYYLATWETFEPAVTAIEKNNPGIDNYENTGPLDLSAYAGDLITIAFVYYAEGSRLTSTIFRVDNVKVDIQ